MLLFTSIVIVLLLLVSASCSAIETAYIACSPAKIHRAKENGNANAEIALELMKSREKVISTFLILCTGINTIATTICASLFIELYGDDTGTLISTFVMGTSVIIFAEIIPKGVSISMSESTVLYTAKIVRVLMYIMKPVNHALHYFLIAFCKIFRIDLNKKVSLKDEMRGLLEHHHQEGTVYKSDKDMLDSVLEMKEIIVEEIMVHRSQIYSIDADLSMDKIISNALSSNYSRIPVWQNNKDNIIGILHVRELFKVMQRNSFKLDNITLDMLLLKPWFIPNNVRISAQLSEFRKHKLHIAMIVNEYGDLQGLVTLEDIIEEIVGQIEDEHDKLGSMITVNDNGTYSIDGSTTIRDINRELSWNLSDEDATTIAGLLMHHTGRVPDEGEVITLYDLNFIIQKKISNQIRTVQVDASNKTI